MPYDRHTIDIRMVAQEEGTVTKTSEFHLPLTGIEGLFNLLQDQAFEIHVPTRGVEEFYSLLQDQGGFAPSEQLGENDMSEPDLRRDPPEVMDLEELSEYLQLNPITLRKMIRRGELPVARVAGKFRFLRRDIDAWLSAQMRTGGAAGDEGEESED